MKICLDMRPALSQATGVGIYLQNLVRALSEIDTQNEYHLFYSSWKEDAPRTNYGKNFIVHNQKWPVRVLNFAWHRLGWPPVDWLIRSEMDVVHSPGPLLTPTSNAHQITTVMDLYFYFYPEDTQSEIKRDYKALVQKHSSKADAIIAISEHTRQILIDRFGIHPSQIYLIRLAADPYFSEKVPAESTNIILERMGVTKPYFLFVGGYEPRKNLANALDAFYLLNEKDCKLIVVGPTRWPAPPIKNPQQVIQLGYVSREDLRALYRESIALVMPSKEEGFGIPALEAMAAGTAVIGSDLAVFHEICGDSFYPVPSNNVEAICQAMRLMLQLPERREKLIELGLERVKKFSWNETAQKTLELYRSL
jgi:glycosyltransferase involved in cell wall biosynthesis